jgi:hypothetical protein
MLQASGFWNLVPKVLFLMAIVWQEIGKMAGWEMGAALAAAASCSLGWCLAWYICRMRRLRLQYNSSAIEVPKQPHSPKRVVLSWL